MPHVVVGTAGHIDHGKSSLVLALTGTDPDRLPEEQKRKITIDLGYAFLDDNIAIIDVPGHEKFIRNMVAGASTVDFALLVVAADDGVMPQTTEHLHILRLLGVRSGCIVITKIDAAESDWIDLVEEQISDAVSGTFLENRPVIRVDSISRAGIDSFRDFLIGELSSMQPRGDRGVFRLPIDRVFSLHGHGTVVTGTVLAGTVKKDARLTVLPGEHAVRAKHVQSHGKDSAQVLPGQRAALNLIGDTKSIERGNTLTEANSLSVSTRIRIAIELLPHGKSLKDRQRIRFLIGTDEILGRVQILSQANRSCIANLLLEKPAVSAWGDRFIIRRYSPMETLGGGRVLEPRTPRLKSAQRETELSVSKALNVDSLPIAVKAYIEKRGIFGIQLRNLARTFACSPEAISGYLTEDILTIQDCLITERSYQACAQTIQSEIESFHDRHPEQQGMPISELKSAALKSYAEPVLQYAIDDLVKTGALTKSAATLAISSRELSLTVKQRELIDRISLILKRDKFTPPLSAVIANELSVAKPEIEKSLVLMERLGRARRLGVDLFFDTEIFENAVRTIKESLRESSGLGVSDISKLLESSRKYAVPFVEYLDNQGITRREGNIRLPGNKLLEKSSG